MEYTKCNNDIEGVMKGAKKHGEDNQQKSFPLRPSGALKSDLDLYFDLVNYFEPGTIPKDDMEGRVHILLESGHVLEDFIVDQFDRVHKVTERNERVTYGSVTMPDGSTRELNGEYDFTFIDNNSGKEMLGDSKTASDFAFKATAKPMYGRPPALPKEEHLAQLNLYMHSEDFKKRGIDTARIVYYNKNNSDYDIYEFKYSEALALKTLARFQHILDMYKVGQAPEQEYFWGHHWKAAYGSYRTHLHKQYKVKKQDRHIITVSDDEFNAVTEGKMTQSIYNYAKTYQDKAIRTNSGKSAYMSLTQKGLVVRVTDKGGFTTL